MGALLVENIHPEPRRMEMTPGTNAIDADLTIHTTVVSTHRYMRSYSG